MKKELTEKNYDEFLNECYGDVEIAGMKHPTSQVLKEVDPIAYDVGFSDWSSNEEENEE
jgi:hypothetical protein